MLKNSFKVALRPGIQLAEANWAPACPAPQLDSLTAMELSLRPATDEDLAFCESLNRGNMAGYLADRGINWDSDRFLASWAEFENMLIMDGPNTAGHLRLLPENGALAIRDLQVVPARRGEGIGSWAVQQAQGLAANRGYREVRLRVYEDNPAKRLYSRLGFKVTRSADGTIHMSCVLPFNNSR